MTQRDRILVTVFASVALLAAFYMAVLKPQRAALAGLDTEAAEQVQRRDAAQAKVAQGDQARQRYADDYRTIVRLGRAVPVDEQVPSLVFGLEATAKRHSVDLRNLKLRAGANGAAPPPPPPAPPAQTAPSGGNAGGAGPAVPANGAAAAVAAPGSAVGPAGFPTLPFDFKFEGDFFRFERFLSAVERFTTTTGQGDGIQVRGRLITIDGFGLKASELHGFPRVSAAISATAYIDPAGGQALATATPAGPASTAAGAVQASGAGSAPASAPSTTTATARGMTP